MLIESFEPKTNNHDKERKGLMMRISWKLRLAVCAGALSVMTDVAAEDVVLHLNGGETAVAVDSGKTVVVTSLVEDTPGCGATSDIVKSGAGTLVLPTGISTSYRHLLIDGGLVSVAAESCFGSGDVRVSSGGLRYTATLTQGRKTSFVGDGEVVVDAGVTYTFKSNFLAVASGKSVTKKGQGIWKMGTVFVPGLTMAGGSKWIVDEGTLQCNGGSMFGGRDVRSDIALEVHEQGSFVVTSGDQHTPLSNLILRGGTVRAPLAQYRSTDGQIEGAGKWKGLGLNGPITVLASEQTSRIVARQSHLAHNAGWTTVFDVREGATLEMDVMLQPGIDNDGNFVKKGAGTLRFLKPVEAAGTALVEEGDVELAPGVRLPTQTKILATGGRIVLRDGSQVAGGVSGAPALCASADVWMDATRYVGTDGATVSAIPNLGMAGGSFGKPQWTRGSYVIPALPTYVASGINGKPAFGFNGGQGLMLTAYTNHTANIHVFYVARWTHWEAQGGKGKWGGAFSFGNRTMTTTADKTPGAFVWKHNGDSNPGYVTLTASQKDCLVDGSAFAAQDPYVPFQVYGRVTDSAVYHYLYGGDDAILSQSKSISSPANLSVDLILLGGQITTGGAALVKSTSVDGSGIASNSENRMFIGNIGELLVFTRKLESDEVAAVNTYLRRKWFDSQLDVSREISAATTLLVPAAERADFSCGTDGGCVGAVLEIGKTGEGTLHLGGDASGAVRVNVKAGGLDLAPTAQPSHANVWIDASDVSTVVTDDNGKVTNLVNKGSCGGVFTKCYGTDIPDGPSFTSDAEGINNHPVLKFAGVGGLVTSCYTNRSSPRNISVYMVGRRTFFADAGGSGRWACPYVFSTRQATGKDDNTSGTIFFQDYSGYARFNYDGGSYVDKIYGQPVDGTASIMTFHNSTNGYLVAWETASSSAEIAVKNDMDNPALDIDVLQLGLRLGAGGVPQWNTKTPASRRSWFGDIGEMIVCSEPLTQAQETELFGYLRKKWLNKGSGSITPPAWLTGVPMMPVTGMSTELKMADGTSLRHEAGCLTLGNLETTGSVNWTRIWNGLEPSGIKMFSVSDSVNVASGTLELVPSYDESAVLIDGAAQMSRPDFAVVGKPGLGVWRTRVDGSRVYLYGLQPGFLLLFK